MIVALMFFAVSLAPGEPALRHQPSSNSLACRKLPIAALESAVGAKAAAPAGSDRDKFSSCRVTVGTVNVKLEYHQPGQPGLPADVKTGLLGAAEMMGSGDDIKILESKDFGNIGCLSATVSIPGLKGYVDTTCFLPKGYYTLSLGREGAAIPMDTVKGLLEKVAAAR
jgi:hypothetical protein